MEEIEYAWERPPGAKTSAPRQAFPILDELTAASVTNSWLANG
jgi:hypothetical protein